MNANLCFICINELLYEKVCNAILILFLNVSSKKIFFFFFLTICIVINLHVYLSLTIC